MSKSWRLVALDLRKYFNEYLNLIFLVDNTVKRAMNYCNVIPN